MAVREADVLERRYTPIGNQCVAGECEVVVEVGGVVEMDHQRRRMWKPFIQTFETRQLVLRAGAVDTAFENAEPRPAFYMAGPFRLQRRKSPGEAVADGENEVLVRFEVGRLVETADFVCENLVGGPAKPETPHRDIFSKRGAKYRICDVMAWRVKNLGTPRFVKARPPQSHIYKADGEQDEGNVPRADFEPIPQVNVFFLCPSGNRRPFISVLEDVSTRRDALPQTTM